MAEAIGILGTAVGVTSLGIQVCQGLIAYFSAYKDQDAVVQKVSQQISTLESLLSLTRDLLRSLSQDHSPLVMQVEALVVQCKSSIVQLGEVLEKCNRGSIQNGLTHRVQRKVQGALFPFRLESLQNLQTDVGIIQDNLNMAFGLLQLDVSSLTTSRCLAILESFHLLSPKIQELSDDLSTAKSQINMAVDIFSEIRSSTSAVAEALPQLQDNFAHAALSHEKLFSMVSKSLDSDSARTGAHRLAIQNLKEQINIRCKSLIQSVDQSLKENLKHHQTSVVLSFDNQDEQFHNLSAQISQIPQAVVNRLQALNLQPPRMARDKPRNNAFSSCTCGFDLSAWNYHARGISLRMWQTSLSRKVHKRNCALYTPLHRTEYGVTYYGRCISGMVSLSLAMVNGAGVLSLSPNITYRATVPRTSPAFALMTNVVSYELAYRYSRRKKDLKPVELLNKTRKDLQQLYQDRMFNPTDVDDNGKTLFHYGCDLAKEFVRIYDESTVFHAAKDLLLQIQSYNVPTNDIDIHGQGALDPVVTEAFTDGTVPVIQLSLEMMNSGVETSEIWSQSIVEKSKYIWYNFFRHVAYSSQSLIDISAFQDSLQFRPLSRSILKRDEKLVKLRLTEDRSCLDEKTALGQSPLHLSADWPVGISLILAHGGRELVDAVDSAGFLPVSYASYRQCLEGVNLLLEAGSALYSEAVDNVLNSNVYDVLRDAMFNSSGEIVQCLIWHMANIRRQLHQLAMGVDPAIWKRHNLPDLNSQMLNAQTSDIFHILESLEIEIPTRLRLNRAGDVYDLLFELDPWYGNTVENSLEYAQMFWDAGFRDVNEFADGYPSLERKWALLFEHGHWLNEKKWTKIICLLSWLVERGADISKPDLPGGTISHTPASHFIARMLMTSRYKLWIGEPDFSDQAKKATVENFVTSIMQEESTCDRCICSCSKDGCTALVQMLKESYISAETQASYQSRCQLYSWAKVEESISLGAWNIFFPTIIRFETFTALELTHTCCTYQHNFDAQYFAYYDEDNGAEIRQEEDEDLQKLEELVAEFISIYLERGGSVISFLEGYWRERMDEVMQRKGDVDLEARAEIRRTGVVLYS